MKDFLNDCLAKASYSSEEIKLLEKLLNAIPKEDFLDFCKNVYLDKLNLATYGKNGFELASIKVYVLDFLKQIARKKALESKKSYFEKKLKDESLKSLIEYSLRLNGEGDYLIADLQKLFYNRLSKNIQAFL